MSSSINQLVATIVNEIFAKTIKVTLAEVSTDVCVQTDGCGVVPYLGTYLTVLTMLDTALPDTVEVNTQHTHKFLCFV